MKHNLGPNGLSLSQATSISNLCYQRANEITKKLNGLNNATHKITIEGKEYVEVEGRPVPTNIVELIMERASLHACQGFLIANIKAKDVLLKEKRTQLFVYSVDAPKKPEYEKVELLQPVSEDWGWNQLSSAEMCEYMDAEAHAAHIGQFIHKGSPLDKLREELPTIKQTQWMEIEKDKKTPVSVTVHHTQEDLLKYHEQFAALHRKYEQRVNYFKSKIKNLITLENARIQKENADKQATVNKLNEDLRNEYETAYSKYTADQKVAQLEFESQRQKDIKEISTWRIVVDERFQPTVDKFAKDLEPEA